MQVKSTSAGRLGAILWAVALGSSLLFSAASDAAGQAPTSSAPPAGLTLKTSTDVVNVYAVVRDKKGRLLTTLQKEDFVLTEGDTREEIRYFSRETDTPLTLGILMDTSPWQEHVLSIEQEQARAFVRQTVRPRDLAFVLEFNVEVEVLQNLTADVARLESGVQAASVRGNPGGPLPPIVPPRFPLPRPGASDWPRLPLPWPGAGNEEPQAPSPCHSWSHRDSRLHDAVYLAANELLKKETGRKALLLLGDGVDDGSQATLHEALEAAHRSDVIIYSIAVVDRRFHTDYCRERRECFHGASVLKKLSEETGGRVIEVSHARDTAAAFQEIGEELRTQYFLGYTPSNRDHDGSYRKIRLQARGGNYKVQARRGYYAPVQ